MSKPNRDTSYRSPNRNSRRGPPPKKPLPWTALVLLAALILSLAYIWRPWEHPNNKAELWGKDYQFINLGLDLRGGLRVALAPENGATDADTLDRVKTIIENRINALGVAEPTVTVQGGKRVVVEVPGATQAVQDRVLNIIKQQAKLEFRIVNQGAQPDPTTRQYKLSDLGPALATGEAIASAQVGTSQTGQFVVNFKTTPAGADTFAKFTRANVQRLMAIVLDGQIKSVATINEPLSDNIQISGNFTSEEASNLALVLKSGSLPVKIKIEEERAIGPSLGADAIRQGAIAGLVGIGLIFVMAFAYYGLYFGLVIAAGLMFTTLIMLGILGGLGATLTLPGIAGLVLTLGAAVDGNVISFERIKEELRRGKGIRNSVGAGFQHSTVTILDVNLSHLLVALALYNYATGPVRGFAVTLAIGVVASVFSNLVFGKAFLNFLARRKDFGAPQWFATPKFDFIRVAPIVTTLSLLLAIGGGILAGTKGLHYSIDFSSGTAITVNTAKSVTADQLRATAGEGAQIQEAAAPNANVRQYVVKVGELTQPQTQALNAKLETLPGGKVQQVETIGPSVGQDLRSQTIKAVALALALILIYVAFRFDIVFGVASVIATIHAVGIVMGVYALFGLEFGIASVAAVLTVIGYALNDAIIVSDRIRENLRAMRGTPYKELVNLSINQTLSRTVMTSVSTALPLLSLAVLGGSVLRDFGLIMLIGIVVGTYSSIFIVSPMVVYFEGWLHRRRGQGAAKSA